MMHIVAIEDLKQINKKTKSIESLSEVYEKQKEILSDAICAAKYQECKDATMLTAYEWSYFDIDFAKLSNK